MKETISCIESIQKLEYEEKYIVVVDNASDNQNEFFDCLKKRFQDEQNIVYLKSLKNLGYAKGNNIGIDYAKNKMKADFICVINPDVVIQSSDYIERCIELYKEYGFAVLGPRIIKNGSDSNPLGGYIESVWHCIYRYFENWRIYIVKRYNLKRFNVLKWKNAIRQKTSDTKEKTEVKAKKDTYFLTKDMQCSLSGACLVFSPLFLNDFKGFCEETFLYCEEYILACVCFNLGYGVLYTSKIRTEHEGGKSLINIENNDDNRQMYISKIRAHSCWVLAKIYMHKKNKEYLMKCLNPAVSEYSEV